jgi:hypothetical protein
MVPVLGDELPKSFAEETVVVAAERAVESTVLVAVGCVDQLLVVLVRPVPSRQLPANWVHLYVLGRPPRRRNIQRDQRQLFDAFQTTSEQLTVAIFDEGLNQGTKSLFALRGDHNAIRFGDHL